jgi:hypothetical protein
MHESKGSYFSVVMGLRLRWGKRKEKKRLKLKEVEHKKMIFERRYPIKTHKFSIFKHQYLTSFDFKLHQYKILRTRRSTFLFYILIFHYEDVLSVTLSYGYDYTKMEEMERHICVSQNVHESALALQASQTVPYGNVFIDLILSYKKLLWFSLQALELELKPLPYSLKYVFIGDNNTLLVIIAKGLTSA